MGDHPSPQDRPGAHALRVRLYGDPAVVLPDGRGVALERRAAALLALAALEPGDATPAAAQLLGGLAYEDCAQFDAWLHYLNQDTACAHAAFENLERMLATEFGARPSAETLALMRRRGGRGQPVG